MGVSGNSIAGKSFQSFAVSEELLAKVTEAVQAGEKQARSSGSIQSFEVFYRGFRQNIAIGRIYVIPASVCSDRKDFPTALLYGCLVKEFGGEEIGDMVEKKIGESEFDEYSQADFDTIKEKLFGVDGGKFESLILFAPSWSNKREYIAFKFTQDEAKLKNNLRHQVFSAYYDPRLSSAFDALMTNVNTTKVDVTDITPKMPFPFLSEGLLKAYPDLQKQASNKKKIFLTRHTADEITQEVLDPQELDVFESLDQALTEALMPGTETVEEAGEPSEGGFNTPDTEHDVPRLAHATEQKPDPDKAPQKPEDKKASEDGEAPIGIAIDETGVPRSETEAKLASADAFTPVSKKDKVHPGNLTDADVVASIDEKKWGTATIPINFGKRQGGVPTVKSASQPDYRTPVSGLDTFTRQYLVTALWSSNDESDESGGEPLENNYGVGDFAPEALQEAIGVCRNFQQDNAQLLEQAYERPGYNEGRAAHDFWLTRNGHGAGYGDRTELEEGGLGDQLTEAAKKFGEADVYVGDNHRLYFNESSNPSPQHDLEFQASYVASKMGKLVDYDGYEAASPKAKKAQADREAKLAKNRHKQADVPMDIDSIWAEITEDMGPAPQIDLPGEGGASADGGGETETKSESKPEGSSDGRPRKSDIGKMPEGFKPFEKKDDSATPEPKSEPEEEKDEKEWHVSSREEDFVKEAFEQDDLDLLPEGYERVHCDQCQMLSINGIPTHEHGCPNSKKRWDAERQDWVRYFKCFECGEEVSEDNAERHAEEHEQGFFEPEEDDPMEMGRSEEGEDYYDGPDDGTHEASLKKADAVQPDIAEAKAEVVSPDTVDSTIQQETKSVPEAAKVGTDVSSDVSEAKAEVVSPDTVDADIQQDTKSVEEAAKVANADGQCPRCNSYDTDEVDAEEGKHLYCHGCEQLSKMADAKIAAAGDDMPEEVPIDLGAGDLADVVMAEEDTDGK